MSRQAFGVVILFPNEAMNIVPVLASDRVQAGQAAIEQLMTTDDDELRASIQGPLDQAMVAVLSEQELAETYFCVRDLRKMFDDESDSTSVDDDTTNR